MALISKSERKAMRSFVLETAAQERRATNLDRDHAHLLVLVLIADSLSIIAGQNP